MCLGREFQRVGSAIEKALSPQVQCLVLSGGDRRLASEERRLREGVCGRATKNGLHKVWPIIYFGILFRFFFNLKSKNYNQQVIRQDLSLFGWNLVLNHIFCWKDEAANKGYFSSLRQLSAAHKLFCFFLCVRLKGFSSWIHFRLDTPEDLSEKGWETKSSSFFLISPAYFLLVWWTQRLFYNNLSLTILLGFKVRFLIASFKFAEQFLYRWLDLFEETLRQLSHACCHQKRHICTSKRSLWPSEYKLHHRVCSLCWYPHRDRDFYFLLYTF